MAHHPSSFDARAIVFDLDGVLVDTMPAIRAVWTEWAVERNLAPAEVLGSIHMTGVELIRRFAPDVDPRAEIEAIAARQRGLETSVARYPGALELLDMLPLERWAIVTSARRVGAVRHLTMAGLPEPRVLVTADDTVRGKPDPTGYRMAAERLGFEPHDCVAVEDSPAGAVAALAAGMFTVAVATTHDAARLRHASVVVASVASLRVTLDPGEDGGRMRVGWKDRVEDLDDPA